MSERVDLKIQELKRIQAEEYYKKKDADLYSWELTEKNEKGKEVPITISDEEYEALIAASNGVNMLASRNNVAKALNVVAVATIVVGFIVGFAIMTFTESNFGFGYLSIAMLISVLMAAMFWGIAEAIKLLQQLIDGKTHERPSVEYQPAAQTQTMAQAPVQAQPAVQIPVQPQPVVRPQYQAYAPAQPVVQPQAQPQYQVTYTTATPPFVQLNPQQYQPVQPQPVQYQQVPPTMPR